MRILHIHSDWKFLPSLASYDNPKIENEVIFIGDKHEERVDIEYFPFTKKNIIDIANIAETFDIVIFYSLRLEHSLICEKISSKVIVIWRFFGAELYSLLNKELLSKESQRYFNPQRIHHALSVIKNTILYSAPAETIFWRAVNRADYISGLSTAEYDYLKNRFDKLPPFIQLPFRWIEPRQNIGPRNIILLGHSKDIYGNHLEVLRRLTVNPSMCDYNFVMFFSYGQGSERYTNAVINEVKAYDNIRVINEFLGRKEYEEIVGKASALVINSYRQQGMGNVFGALRNGIKVYLSENNVMCDWLVKEGFIVGTLEDFMYDISKNNVALSPEQVSHNVKVYKRLTEKYSVEGYHQLLLSLIKECDEDSSN